MEQLPSEDVSILILYSWEELTGAQVGEIYSLTAEAVRKRVSRIREKLSEMIDGDEQELDLGLREAGELCLL